MYEADIERLVAQARRIQRLGEEVLDDAETLDDNGVDTTTATDLGDKQTELQNQMEQALLDFETALERSDGVGRYPNYVPGANSFDISWDETAEEITIKYTNTSTDLSNQYITVNVAGTEQSNLFSDPTTAGDTEIIDTTNLVDGDKVFVEWIATDDASNKHTLPNANRSPVGKTNLPPESRLIGETRTFNKNVTITR